MENRIPVKVHANRKASAIRRNRDRPKRSRTDHTFALVLDKILGFMKPEVGNLTWVSFETIAKETPFSRDTIKHYLTAAELIGAMVKKYRTAREAHKKTKLFYPKYNDYTYGKTFMELLVPKLNETGKVRPKRLLYWTLNLKWVGYNWIDREYLPDWMLEVIRLCATQKPENVHEAKRITVRHRIGYGIEPESGIVNEGVNTLQHKLSGYAFTNESGIVNEGARPPEILLFEKMVSGSYPQDTPSEKPEPENGIVNDPARGEHVSLLRENGDEGPTPSATIEEKQEPGASKLARAVCG